jgi:hypothetical protein
MVRVGSCLVSLFPILIVCLLIYGHFHPEFLVDDRPWPPQHPFAAQYVAPVLGLGSMAAFLVGLVLLLIGTAGRAQIAICFLILILIAVPTLLYGLHGNWDYSIFLEMEEFLPIGLAVVALPSLALLVLSRARQSTAIFALIFTVIWVGILLPDAQYYLNTHGGTADVTVESFNRRAQLWGYILVLFPIPFVLLGVCFRRNKTSLRINRSDPPSAV